MLPEWVRILELVTIHEFGHQYWYGLLASNEAEEAWLDEGINSYTEQRIMDEAYGPGAVIDLPGFKISDHDMQRLSYTKNYPSRGAIFTKSWEYQFGFGDYGRNSYAKPATVLGSLERYLGEETMLQVMRTYYERWRFRHPTTRDFIDVAEEVSGQSLDWFFDQYIYGTTVVDYEVTSIQNTQIAGFDGAEAERYSSRVRVRRNEDGIFPQTLRVRFEDGQTEDIDWNGEEDWKDFKFERRARLVEAFLDPEDHIRLDINRLNNRKSVESDNRTARKYGFKFFVWIQQLFYLISALA
jgi:aminopeptidase N